MVFTEEAKWVEGPREAYCFHGGFGGLVQLFGIFCACVYVGEVYTCLPM